MNQHKRKGADPRYAVTSSQAQYIQHEAISASEFFVLLKCQVVQDGGSPPNMRSSSSVLTGSSSVLTGSSSVLELPSSILGAGEATKRDAEGRILTPKLELPLLDDLSKLPPVFRARLEAMAALPRTKKKLPREQLREVLINLCHDQFVCLRALAELVGRKPDALRNEYLTPMVRDVVMALAFPKTPTHELQAYRSQPRPLKAGDS
jgi:hypothetical protein